MIKDQDSVTFDDSVQTMGNRNNGTVSKFLFDQLLDLLLSNDVDICGGFIEDYDLVLA